jgi:hypothetical protein
MITTTEVSTVRGESPARLLTYVEFRAFGPELVHYGMTHGGDGLSWLPLDPGPASGGAIIGLVGAGLLQ